jgi:hypothetical protein
MNKICYIRKVKYSLGNQAVCDMYELTVDVPPIFVTWKMEGKTDINVPGCVLRRHHDCHSCLMGIAQAQLSDAVESLPTTGRHPNISLRLRLHVGGYVGRERL